MKYWTQAFVHYDRNVDFINDINNRGLEMVAKAYISSNGNFEYEIRSDDQAELGEVIREYSGNENYSFESSNLDYEFQYPEGI